MMMEMGLGFMGMTIKGWGKHHLLTQQPPHHTSINTATHPQQIPIPLHPILTNSINTVLITPISQIPSNPRDIVMSDGLSNHHSLGNNGINDNNGTRNIQNGNNHPNNTTNPQNNTDNNPGFQLPQPTDQQHNTPAPFPVQTTHQTQSDAQLDICTLVQFLSLPPLPNLPHPSQSPLSPILTTSTSSTHCDQIQRVAGSVSKHHSYQSVNFSTDFVSRQVTNHTPSPSSSSLSSHLNPIPTTQATPSNPTPNPSLIITYDPIHPSFQRLYSNNNHYPPIFQSNIPSGLDSKQMKNYELARDLESNHHIWAVLDRTLEQFSSSPVPSFLKDNP